MDGKMKGALGVTCIIPIVPVTTTAAIMPYNFTFIVVMLLGLNLSLLHDLYTCFHFTSWLNRLRSY